MMYDVINPHHGDDGLLVGDGTTRLSRRQVIGRRRVGREGRNGDLVVAVC
ncbi:hypothetical protein [Halorubellus sp. PRR65]|nr:hypothetical protein [Halorubellus sp. PRR65]